MLKNPCSEKLKQYFLKCLDDWVIQTRLVEFHDQLVELFVAWPLIICVTIINEKTY